MPDYIELDLGLDATAVYEDAMDTMRTLAPEGWEPSEVEQWLLEAVARIAVEIAVLAGSVPTAIFTYFGQTILNIAALAPAAATGTITFTLLDTTGHVIDAGTQLSIDGVAFTTDGDLTIPAGADTGTTAVTAVNPGTGGNDLAGDQIDIITPSYLFIETVTLDAPTADGADGETGDEYADRLADELPTLSPKAILISDFAALARRNPLVGRALAIDNYDADTLDDDAEGHITVVVHDTAGDELDEDVRDAIKAEFEAGRVLGIVAHVINGEYTTIDVDFSIDVYDDYDPDAVVDAAEAAVTAALAPTEHGRPSFADSSEWVNETTVYRADLIGVVRTVPGVRHVTGLELAATGDPLAEDDVVMTGIAPLTRAGDINGSLT